MKGILSCASAGALLLTGFIFPQTALATDVSIYSVAKGVYFEQVSPGSPAALTNNGYVFSANVSLTAPGSVTSAFVQPPGGTAQELSLDGTDQLEFKKKYNTSAKLDSNYPNGNFLMTLNTAHDGTRSIALPLEGSIYPPAPHIINFSEAQQVNAAGYFQVRWDRMAGGTTSDFIQLRIEDASGNKVFETPDFGESGALNCEATSALIRSGTLQANTAYQATLLFQKNVTLNSSTYGGALGAASYFGRTSFPLVTSGAGKTDVESYTLAKGRTFVQADSGAPTTDTEKPYVIEAKVHGSAGARINNSALLTPNNNSLPLLADKDAEDYEYSDVAVSEGLLDSNFPSGNYTLSINTVHDGTRSPSLYLSPTAYPAAPHLNNFNPSEEIRANQDLVLQWDSWAEGTENDFIQLRIENKDGDKIFETLDLGESKALNGRATRVVIPVGTLAPGKSYRGRLTFQKIGGIDTAAYLGALGVVSFFAKTKFDVDTAPADVKTFSVFKGHEFVQHDSGAPTQISTAFVFTASVVAEGSGTVNGVSVITPQGAIVPLVLQADGKTFSLVDGCADQAMVDAAYPEGSYRLQISTAHEGTVTPSLQISGYAYPNAPHLRNFAALQMADASSPLALNWDAFVGGNSNDFVFVEIGDSVGGWFVTKSYGKSGALNGTATTVTVPDGAFVANHLYKGRLLFEKILAVNETAYPGAEGLAGYFARTQFTVATAGPDNPPRLSSWQLTSGAQVKFTLRALAGGDYRIDSSTNLIQWLPLRTISATQNETEFFDSTQAHPSCFYRAVFVP